MTPTPSRNSDSGTRAGELAGGRLGAWGIVFFVVSAAAPLTVLVSGAPFSIRLGGIGAPGAILVAGIVLILFALGYSAMSQQVRNAGAFYAYAKRGLGPNAGNGIALMTTVAYGLLLVGFYGFLGYFAELTVEDLFDLSVHWSVWALLAAALVGALGYRHIDVGAKVVAVLLSAEVALLLALSVAVLVRGGPEPLSAAPFSPSNVFFATGAGSLFVLGFGSYIGFEGTAIYAEEAKDPHRTVPTATYIAIGFLALFYAFTYWVVIMAFGTEGVVAVAQGDDFGNMLFVAADRFLGEAAEVTMRALIVTSFLALVIAFHNACARYIFSLGRAGLLPRAGARTHPQTHAPHRASQVLTAIVVVSILVTLLLGGHPYLQLGVWTYAAGVVAIVFAQGVCALAVTVFFARDRRGYSAWRVVVAPAFGALGLAVGVYLIATNFEVITGTTGLANWLLLLPTPLFFIVGVATGIVVKRRHPDRLEALEQPDQAPAFSEPPAASRL